MKTFFEQDLRSMNSIDRIKTFYPLNVREEGEIEALVDVIKALNYEVGAAAIGHDFIAEAWKHVCDMGIASQYTLVEIVINPLKKLKSLLTERSLLEISDIDAREIIARGMERTSCYKSTRRTIEGIVDSLKYLKEESIFSQDRYNLVIQLSEQKENEYLLSCTHILWYLSRSEKTLTAEIADICLNLENKDLIFIIAEKGMSGLRELVDQHLPVTRQSLFKISEKIITNTLTINTVKSEDVTKKTEAESNQAKLKNADDNSNLPENHSGGGCTIM